MISRPQNTLNLLIFAVIGVLIAGVSWAFYITSKNQSGGGAPMGPTPVEAMTLKPQVFIEKIQTVGTLRSNESVIVRPELSGRVDGIHFKEGQDVKKGDILITLDARTARAALQDARAVLTLNTANYHRSKLLYERRYASLERQDQAQAAYEQAQANVTDRALILDKMTLRAPFDGTVGFRNVSVGDYVAPGQNLVNLEAIDTLKIEFSLPEKDLSRMRIGQTLRLKSDAIPDQTMAGTIYAINPQLDAAGRDVRVRGYVPNEKRLLKPGMFVRVWLEVHRYNDALMAPEECIVPQGAQSFVYTVKDSKAVLNPVSTGLRGDGLVQITSGLKPGDQIITSGQMKVRPMAPVQIIPGHGKKAGPQ